MPPFSLLDFVIYFANVWNEREADNARERRDFEEDEMKSHIRLSSAQPFICKKKALDEFCALPGTKTQKPNGKNWECTPPTCIYRHKSPWRFKGREPVLRKIYVMLRTEIIN